MQFLYLDHIIIIRPVPNFNLGRTSLKLCSVSVLYRISENGLENFTWRSLCFWWEGGCFYFNNLVLIVTPPPPHGPGSAMNK